MVLGRLDGVINANAPIAAMVNTHSSSFENSQSGLEIEQPAFHEPA